MAVVEVQRLIFFSIFRYGDLYVCRKRSYRRDDNPAHRGKVFDYVGSVSFLAEGCILCFAAFGAYLAVLIIGKGAASHDVHSREVLGEGEGKGEEDKGKIDTNAEQDSDQLVTKETFDDKSPNR
ncbi:glucose transmembrane transporter [Desmophyllum pertusum]|uniref:Glucose transmembrane transporter n=1 Tax=Desmophyllum pertusum TaxID=174260 RepID=A0A9W9Z9S3_9CNID|nr:glucose transmembrane transporter [Desmophyllum pertusum]